MNLPRFSVHHPIFTTMVTLIVVILGAVSMVRVRTDLLPEVELPTLSVRTDYEGANPEVVERLITTIIEEIVATVPGVELVESSSREGRSSVSVTFGWGVDIDTAAVDLKATVEDEINELPDEITAPRISKFDINSFPVVVLGITSKQDPVVLTDLINTQLRYRFGRVPGVAQVDTWGEYSREMRVELDPDRVKALGIPMQEIRAAIRASNVDLPAGRIERGRYEISLRAPSEFQSVDELRDTVVSIRDGDPVTIGDLGEVVDTHRRKTRIVRINEEEGIRVAIRKEADANTVEVSQGILAEVEAINRDYPQINAVPILNQGNFIESSIANVSRSVLTGGSLAILILLFFLRNLRSTIVIALSIPISVIATFAMIYFGGFTLNLMTLGGLALGVGMMVDSSVVVLENIFRRQQEEGDDPEQASIQGSSEVATAILASTLTTLVIFLPMVFVGGVSGILFQELALVVVFSLICALLVSLSLVPMLSSKLLKANESSEMNSSGFRFRCIAFADRVLDGLQREYSGLLELALKHRPTTIMVSLVLLIGSSFLAPHLGSEFLPPSDEGIVRINGEMEPGTRLDLVEIQARKLEMKALPAVPEKVSWVTTVHGGADPRAELEISVGSAASRDRDSQQIAEELRDLLINQFPGMELNIWAPEGQFLLQRIIGGGGGIDVEISGFDLAVLRELTSIVEQGLWDIPGVNWVRPRKQEGTLQEEIRIDRAKAASLGIRPEDVSRFIETAVAGSQAGEFRRGGLSYPILIQLKDAHRRSIDEILDLPLTSVQGEPVALRNLVEIRSSIGPQEINRKNQQRIATIRVGTAEQDKGALAERVQEFLNTLPRPDDVEMRIAGSYEEQQKSFRELTLSLGLALIFVYMVLACQYESLLNPIIVMASVPLAAIGVFVTLYLTRTTLNLQSYIGCIMLGGIVVNNAILLVDQSSRLVQDGLSPIEAVTEAGRRRLRPILMTTLTTILALLPLAFGVGEGADAQAPMARAVTGGLAASTLITLVLIPVIFSLVHDKLDRKAA